MTSAEAILDFVEPVLSKNHENGIYYQTVVDAALSNIADGTAKVIGVSGKKAAGKDTFYDEYITEIDKVTAKVPTSAAIRAEATEIINFLYDALEHEPLHDVDSYWDDIASQYDEQFSIAKEQAVKINELLLKVIRDRDGVTGFDRDNEITTVLQILGNEAHAGQDELYWARKMALGVLMNAAFGITSIVPDIRYERDAEAIHLLGGKIVRLNISPEVQRERLMKRDGLVVPEKTLGHISEIALDNYEKFDTIVDSNKMSPKEVVHVVKASW